ncbi:MAG: M20 family metallopeptidase [Acidobacteria bacterium]|nr:M20 family metallopeptidase [Acidobacteriota bacterium]
MTPQQTLAYFRSRESQIVDLIRGIVDIESPSHDAAASTRVVDWVESQFKATGADLSIERTRVEDGEHLIIKAYPGEGLHTLLLGHTDTVHPIGTNRKNPTRIEDDKLYGCGIFDMKSGVILMIETLRYFAATNTQPSTPLTIVLSCDEEVGSFTGRPIIEEHARGAVRCLICEPSSHGCVKTARKGTGMFTLRAHGVPAHAGLEPEKGANAVAELARQVESIHAVARPEIGTTVNVTVFRGGTTLNVIPDLAECEIDVRFSQADEAERVTSELRRLKTTDPRVSLELEGEINRPPMERSDAVAALFEKARAAAASFDYDIGEIAVGGGSDGNFVAALGVPVLDGLGITGDGAHRMDEHILISDIAKRAALVTLLLCQ